VHRLESLCSFNFIAQRQDAVAAIVGFVVRRLESLRSFGFVVRRLESLRSFGF